MKPFEKILVPVDFSQQSAEAIRVAADMSRRYEAAVTLVHVFEPPTPAIPDGFLFYMPGQLEKLQGEYARRLSEAKREAESAGALQVEAHQLQGLVPSEIVEFARKHAFDLIVIGTHGRTGIQHALMGSVAERVLRRAPCPVLAVKQLAS